MLRFSVRRRRDKGFEDHFVDLMSLPRDGKFNGKCDCWPFVNTFQPRFDDKMPIGDLTRCTHIKAVLTALADKVVSDIAKEWKGKDEDSL